MPQINTSTCTDFGPNLAPFWEGFGGGSQVGTKSLQKSIQRMIKKMITFWMALETDFDQFWLHLGGVKRGLLGPKMRGRV